VSHDSYSEINLHVVWHTKTSMPLLTPPVETFVHHHVRHRLLAEEGIIVYAVGGTETHVHVALRIPPTVLISELIGRIKGSSAHEANRQFAVTGKVLEWQRGYGVVSFGTRQLPWVKEYVENQREHHARGTVQDRLELAAAPGEQKETS
jgi:putative transposase